MLDPVHVVTITTSIPVPCEPMPCPFCGGFGYIEVDVGQLYECNPCKATGYLLIEEENIYVPR